MNLGDRTQKKHNLWTKLLSHVLNSTSYRASMSLPAMPSRHAVTVGHSRPHEFNWIITCRWRLAGVIGSLPAGSDWISTLDAVSILPTAQVGVLVKLSAGRGFGEPPSTTHDIAGQRRLEPG